MATIRMRITIPANGIRGLEAMSKSIGFTHNMVKKDGGYRGVLLMEDCKVFAKIFYEMGRRNFKVTV